MPLLPGKSKAAFSKNVATEMKAGRPQNESLAIAYATRKRNRKADGGHVHGPMCAEGCMMAEGGKVGGADGYQAAKEETTFSPIHEQTNLDLSHQSSARKMSERAMDEDERDLGQHGAEEEGPTGTWMAEGGYTTEDPSLESETPDVEYKNGVPTYKGKMLGGSKPNQGYEHTYSNMKVDEEGAQQKAEGGSVLGEPTDEHEDREESYITDNLQDDSHMRDMVGRIMAQRQQMYSEGGKVANQEHGHNDNELAGFSPNEFDDLVLRDDLEQSYTGASAGDEDGDHRSHAEDDRVSRIMLKRRKQTNPRPA